MSSIFLPDLRTRVLERANMVGTSFVSTAELDSIINGEGAELHDLIVSAHEDQFTIDSGFTLIGVSYFILTDLPASAPFYKLRGLDRRDGNEYRPLTRSDWSQRGRTSTWSSTHGRDIQYRLVGNVLYLTPAGHVDGTYRLWYVPGYVDLVGDGAIFNYPQQWAECVLAGSAAKLLATEESDPSIQLALKAATLARIMSMAGSRDASGPERIERVRSHDHDDGWGH